MIIGEWRFIHCPRCHTKPGKETLVIAAVRLTNGPAKFILRIACGGCNKPLQDITDAQEYGENIFNIQLTEKKSLPQ